MPALPPLKVDLAGRRLRAGQVIAYPTEGVWGLGCDPHDPVAVERLLAIKRRPVAKGLILVAADIAQFEPYLTGLEANLRARLHASWPGPFTWLVPDNGYAPAWIRGHHSAVALRVSAHPLVAALCRAFGGPLVSTSANRSGRATPRHRWQVLRQLPELDYCLPGALGGAGQPSEIRDLLSNRVIRPGA